MAEQTIYVYATADVTITHADGSPTRNDDLINAAQYGNSFSWENPNDLSFTFSGTPVAVTFEDADGVLEDDPYSGSTVTDQLLTEPVTIGGTTYTPSVSAVRWQGAVNVENEFQVSLFDDAGNTYNMIGVTITEGYSSTVIGVSFIGSAPPPGTTLHYLRGESSFDASGGSDPVEIEDIAAPCFLAGTLIDVASGTKRVEALRPGDLVHTLDNGLQPLRWVGHSTVPAQGPLAPIRVQAGVLGNRRALNVSPNHRILIRSAAAEFYYGDTDVLMPAKALVDGRKVRSVPAETAHYVHLLFARHEMLFAEGLASESLFTGTMALEAFSAASQAELCALVGPEALAAMKLNRPALSVREARALLNLARADQQASRRSRKAA
ncbi:MAG: Hint domain-containing protein [Pseudomonadota bacterium]|nr:Hint domain-containing protein [Pseudomonadota bacterium]